MRVSVRAISASSVLAVAVLVCGFAFADEGKTTDSNKQSDPKQTAAARADAQTASQSEARAVRLTKPWKDLTSLTEDQKRKINEIHRKSVQEVKAIEQREHDDIMALLSEQQKTELTAMTEKDAAAKKAKAGEKPKAGAKVTEKDPAKASSPLAR